MKEPNFAQLRKIMRRLHPGIEGKRVTAEERDLVEATIRYWEEVRDD